jgi:RNA polymerase sigma-70 factor (ECF subfamily)
MQESHWSSQESRLVAAALSGDTGSFEALVNLYERRVYQIAYRIVQNSHDAEDVLQEAFLKAFENLPGFRGESSFYTWVVQIAVNVALQRVNRQRKHPAASLDQAAPDEPDYRPKEIVAWEDNPEELYSRQETRELLEGAIASLPLIYRTVFLLKDVERMPVAKIATTLGISVPAAKSRLIRARLELRERLGKHFRKKGAPIYSAERHRH